MTEARACANCVVNTVSVNAASSLNALFWLMFVYLTRQYLCQNAKSKSHQSAFQREATLASSRVDRGVSTRLKC